MREEWITIAEARLRLGISKVKMAQLVREGKMETRDNTLDKRSKLVRRADVEVLAGGGKAARGPKAKAA